MVSPNIKRYIQDIQLQNQVQSCRPNQI